MDATLTRREVLYVATLERHSAWAFVFEKGAEELRTRYRFEAVA